MRRWAALLALGPVALIGAGCGSDDDDGGAASDGTPPVYTITATESGDDFTFDIPDDIAGGVVTFELVSSKDNKEPHDFQLVKLEGDHDISEVADEASEEDSPVPDWIEHASGVGTVGPGQTSRVTVELEPDAEYGFFCTESGDETGSHAKHGMQGSFTTGESSEAEMPETDATITTNEYGFEIEGLKAGENTITFTNDGKMLHHVLLIPFANNATFEDVKKAFESEEEPEGPPPVDFEKGVFTAVAGTGDSIVYTATLAAGKYAVICFMPDKGTAGPPHIAKGMIQELVIS